MGANAQTTVPTYVAAQVLTAAQLNESARTGVPVFATTVTRDAGFGGVGEKTLAQGQLCYLEATNKLQYYDGTAWANIGGVNNVTAFTASGTFTPPTGVTYAVAYILAGGGGVGNATNAGIGGTSSVAFAAATVSATGGVAYQYNSAAIAGPVSVGTVNSGQGAIISFYADGAYSTSQNGQAGALIVAGGVVTPAVGITVTVGAGGTAGTGGAAGGSGYVWIEYQV